jgi:hypothetical protein
MRLTQAIAAASMIAAIAAPLAAKPARTAGPATCSKVLSLGESTWLAERSGELGTFDGLLNGSFFLSYDPEAGSRTPNLIIKSSTGTLRLWLAGESVQADDGSTMRKLVNVATEGDGDFAGAQVDLLLSGQFVPEKGGSYELSGSICGQAKRPRR